MSYSKIAYALPFRARKISLVGSRKIPAVTSPKDYDFLVLCRRRKSKIKKLRRDGYVLEAGQKSCYGHLFLERFVSLRKDDINIILTDSPKFYADFITATKVCIALNLVDRVDRVKVHKAVLYGEVST